MYVEPLGSKFVAVCPRNGSSPAGRRRLILAALAAAAFGALLPGVARAQFEKFVDANTPTGVAVPATGTIDAIVGNPNRLVQLAPDGSTANEAPLPDELARSRIAWSSSPSFQGAVLLSPAGTLQLVPATQGQQSTGINLASADNPIELQAPDLDGGGGATSISLAGARFDDVAIAPPVAATGGGQSPLEIFASGATAGTGANGQGARPFLVRITVDLAAQQAQLAGIATSQGDASDPKSPSGVGMSFTVGQDGSVTDATVVTSIPTSTHAGPEGAGWTLVIAGTQFPDDTRPEAAPQFVLEDLRIVSPGMTNDDQGNLYMIVSVAGCQGSDAPGLQVLSATETLCTPLPATVAQGSADVGVALAGEPIYLNDESGNQLLRSPAPPNVTPSPTPTPTPTPAPTPNPTAAKAWLAPAR